MSNEETPIEPVQPVAGPPIDPPAAPPADRATSYAPPPPGRMFRVRSVLAVAAAGVVVGGLGGATISHLADHPEGPEHGSSDREGFPGGPLPGGGQLPGGEGQLPGAPPAGQVPSVPRDDSEDQSSSSGGSSAS